jgi:hypothetical protein
MLQLVFALSAMLPIVSLINQMQLTLVAVPPCVSARLDTLVLIALLHRHALPKLMLPPGLLLGALSLHQRPLLLLHLELNLPLLITDHALSLVQSMEKPSKL